MSKNVIVMLSLLLIIIQVKAELKLIVQLYRHGARVPFGQWYDSNQQISMRGELTATGQRQLYNLGAKLREEYKGFIPQQYNHSQIYVRSTDSNRTLMSAASLLQGMFNQYAGSILPLNLNEQYTLPSFKDAQNYLNETNFALPNNIQVFPIHSQPIKGDQVLLPDLNCRNYKAIKNSFYSQKQEVINFVNQQFNNTYQQYSNAINQTVNNFDQMQSLENTFECDRHSGRYVPNFSQELKENATFLSSLSWNFRYNQPDLLRAMNTPFFNQILAYVNPVVQNNDTSGLKWVMFSAHDTNIHLVSAALNFTSIDCLLNQRFPQQFQSNQTFYNCEEYPRFTANLIFELHQADTLITENGVKINKDQFYLRVRRDGKFMNLCQKNSTICSIEEFSQRINYFSKDFDDVCNNPTQQNVSTSETISSYSIENVQNSNCSYYILALIIQQLVIIIGGFFWYKSKYSKKVREFQQFDKFEVKSENNV